MSHYEILGVSPKATKQEIKKAYRRKISKAHTDREGGDNDDMIELNVAYETLYDDDRRLAYDNQDNVMAENMVIHKVSLWLQQADERVSLVDWVTDSLSRDMSVVAKNKSDGMQMLAKLERVMARVSRSDGKANKIKIMLQSQHDHIRMQLENVEKEIAKISRAIEISSEYSYAQTHTIFSPFVISR